MKTFFIIGMLMMGIAGLKAQSDSLQVKQESIDSIAVNQVVIDSILKREILLGYCNRDGLQSLPEFVPFWQKEYTNYEPYTHFLETLTDSLKQLHITIVMGSWCGDSKREVPRFFRLMDELGFDDRHITLICVDRRKKAGPIAMEDYYVEWVPTFIFKKGKVEWGRIVESPAESLENDIAHILTVH